MVSFLPVSHQDPIHTLSSPIRATCSAHLILLDFITRTILGEEYLSFSSSLCYLLHSPVTSSLLGPNILLNTIFSNTLRFLSSRNSKDQVTHPYKTKGKIIVSFFTLRTQMSMLVRKHSASTYKHPFRLLLTYNCPPHHSPKKRPGCT